MKYVKYFDDKGRGFINPIDSHMNLSSLCEITTPILAIPNLYW